MIYPECKTWSLLKIDENLRLWPCSFVCNYTDDFLDALDENWNSLQNKSLNEILNHDAFTKHFNYEHWNDETKCSWICKKECSLPYLKNMDLSYQKKNREERERKKEEIFELGITSHCNAGCSGCDRTDRDTRKARQELKLTHAPTIKIKQCIDESIEYFLDLKTIKFCGDRGDPMMHPDIEELIEYVCDNFQLTINTNGSIRNPDFYKRIVNENLRIMFSIDGLEDTNHIYRYGCNWDNIWNNLTSYCNAGGYAQWDFLVWSHNWHQIPKVKEEAKKLGIEHVEFKVTHQGTHRQSDGTPIVKSVEDEQTLNIIYGLING